MGADDLDSPSKLCNSEGGSGSVTPLYVRGEQSIEMICLVEHRQSEEALCP